MKSALRNFTSELLSWRSLAIALLSVVLANTFATLYLPMILQGEPKISAPALAFLSMSYGESLCTFVLNGLCAFLAVTNLQENASVESLSRVGNRTKWALRNLAQTFVPRLLSLSVVAYLVNWIALTLLVGIPANTKDEWGALSAGVIQDPIYPTMTPSQLSPLQTLLATAAMRLVLLIVGYLVLAAVYLPGFDTKKLQWVSLAVIFLEISPGLLLSPFTDLRGVPDLSLMQKPEVSQAQTGLWWTGLVIDVLLCLAALLPLIANDLRKREPASKWRTPKRFTIIALAVYGASAWISVSHIFEGDTASSKLVDLMGGAAAGPYSMLLPALVVMALPLVFRNAPRSVAYSAAAVTIAALICIFLATLAVKRHSFFVVVTSGTYSTDFAVVFLLFAASSLLHWAVFYELGRLAERLKLLTAVVSVIFVAAMWVWVTPKNWSWGNPFALNLISIDPADASSTGYGLTVLAIVLGLLLFIQSLFTNNQSIQSPKAKLGVER